MLESFFDGSDVDGTVIVIKLNHFLAILVNRHLVRATSQLVFTQSGFLLRYKSWFGGTI